MMMDVNWTSCGDHFAIYTNIESSHCILETNASYINYTAIFFKAGRAMQKVLKQKTFPVSQCLPLDLPWWCLLATVVLKALAYLGGRSVDSLVPRILSSDWAHAHTPPAKDFHCLPVVGPPVEGRKSKGAFPLSLVPTTQGIWQPLGNCSLLSGNTQKRTGLLWTSHALLFYHTSLTEHKIEEKMKTMKMTTTSIKLQAQALLSRESTAQT